MAAQKSYTETDRQVKSILEDVQRGIFKPVYLLMGEEPYFPTLVAAEIQKHCLQDWERDFNETVLYGSSTDADTVITAAMRFPMMAERQLVLLREAQQMKGLAELEAYCKAPLDSTVLVILMHGSSADKRTGFYKSVLKTGEVLESPLLRDYEVPKWIASYYSGRGLEISPDAAMLLAESAGSDLGKIAVETDKLLKNLPEGTKSVGVADIEKNIGISREFSIFELTKCLSAKNAARSLAIARRIADTPRFAMPAVTAPLYTHFSRILKYHALAEKGMPSKADAARILGVNPYFMEEYNTAIRCYSKAGAMRAISLLCEYDFKGKGGDAGEATPGDIFVELILKLLNC